MKNDIILSKMKILKLRKKDFINFTLSNNWPLKNATIDIFNCKFIIEKNKAILQDQLDNLKSFLTTLDKADSLDDLSDLDRDLFFSLFKINGDSNLDQDTFDKITKKDVKDTVDDLFSKSKKLVINYLSDEVKNYDDLLNILIKKDIFYPLEKVEKKLNLDLKQDEKKELKKNGCLFQEIIF